MLTPEREKEIRDRCYGGAGYSHCTCERDVPELLAEIDRLRVWSSDSHVTQLEENLAVAVEALDRIFKYEAITTFPFEQAHKALAKIRGEK